MRNGIIPEECPYYTQGFCIMGPWCLFIHTKREICLNFSHGYCDKGPKCANAHPRAVTVEEQEYFGWKNEEAICNVYTKVTNKLKQIAETRTQAQKAD